MKNQKDFKVALLRTISEYLEMEKQISEIEEEEIALSSEKTVWKSQLKEKRQELEELLSGNASNVSYGGTFEIRKPEDVDVLPLSDDVKNNFKSFLDEIEEERGNKNDL